MRGGAADQQPGQCGGVWFSAEAWGVRQESSSQRFWGRKDLADRVLMSGAAPVAVTRHRDRFPFLGGSCGCGHACVCSADE